MGKSEWREFIVFFEKNQIDGRVKESQKDMAEVQLLAPYLISNRSTVLKPLKCIGVQDSVGTFNGKVSELLNSCDYIYPSYIYGLLTLEK